MLTIQHSGPDGEITTTFEYDGIQRLVRVTDTEGNVTTSTYDMGDRRTEVNHPASGITNFTYDALGNVQTKQTANLAKEGKFITYDYDYQRLTGINYPDHPENNVKYYYGGRNASQNRIGRLMLREDGTGAIEYFYGKIGEVTKTRRTMIVPNQAIATYVTEWKYDSHNRLLEKTYPDGETVSYGYNLGGQLDHVRGYKSYGYDYVNKIGYDKFEQRSYLKYCNGADPRRIPYAGTEADGVTVDYQSKYNRQQQAIKDNYADFGVPYDGEDNNDYVNGQGLSKDIVGGTRRSLSKLTSLSLARQFCCNDNSPESVRVKMLKSSAINNNFHDTEEYERMQFYYHPDHLGSSSYIKNLDGEVVQHIEYVPLRRGVYRGTQQYLEYALPLQRQGV